MQFNGPLRTSGIQRCIPTLLRHCRHKSNCMLSDKPGWFSSLTFSQITWFAACVWSNYAKFGRETRKISWRKDVLW